MNGTRLDGRTQAPAECACSGSPFFFDYNGDGHGSLFGQPPIAGRTLLFDLPAVCAIISRSLRPPCTCLPMTDPSASKPAGSRPPARPQLFVTVLILAVLVSALMFGARFFLTGGEQPRSEVDPRDDMSSQTKTLTMSAKRGTLLEQHAMIRPRRRRMGERNVS